MDDYTPTTEEVRDAFVNVNESAEFPTAAWYREWKATGGAEAEFDRWLASVRADAWDEGAKAVVDLLGIKMVPVKPGEQFEQRPVNPYEKE